MVLGIEQRRLVLLESVAELRDVGAQGIALVLAVILNVDERSKTLNHAGSTLEHLDLHALDIDLDEVHSWQRNSIKRDDRRLLTVLVPRGRHAAEVLLLVRVQVRDHREARLGPDRGL